VHPVLVLAPALTLILGPRFWAGQVLERYNRQDLASAPTARDLARQLLDESRLRTVKIESTDVGDHYDPLTKAVRLGRGKIDRRTLTALTAAAHEVAHALQDASGYGPFVWRARLVKVAQRAGEVAAVFFLAVPLSAIFSPKYPLPPVLIGSAAVAMLGTGLIAQLAAVPSELDASFGRALPLLQDGYINEQQGKAARKILWACSLTYIASSLVSALHIWPWIGRPPIALPITPNPGPVVPIARAASLTHDASNRARHLPSGTRRSPRRKRYSWLESLLRPVGKPVIRLWLRVTDAT